MSTNEKMMRLKWSIQALAAPAGKQIQLFPKFVCVADELAIDFEEALRAVSKVEPSGADKEEEDEVSQLAQELSFMQREAIDAVDKQLEKMSGPEHAEMWTDDALYNSIEWARVRHLAALALKSIGWASELPPQGRAIYVGPPDD